MLAWPGRRHDARERVGEENLERPEVLLENENSIVCDI
jgi:hypothetical protein